MKIRSSQMIGVAVPLPGTFTFHFTWLVSLQVVGGLASGRAPVAKGPRHCGQFCAASAAVARQGQAPDDSIAATSASIINCFMETPICFAIRLAGSPKCVWQI